MKTVNNINQWLTEHPEWILGTELKELIGDHSIIRDVIEKHQFGFLTIKGEYYNSLRDVPSFVGIKQVVKAKGLIIPLTSSK